MISGEERMPPVSIVALTDRIAKLEPLIASLPPASAARARAEAELEDLAGHLAALPRDFPMPPNDDDGAKAISRDGRHDPRRGAPHERPRQPDDDPVGRRRAGA